MSQTRSTATNTGREREGLDRRFAPHKRTALATGALLVFAGGAIARGDQATATAAPTQTAAVTPAPARTPAAPPTISYVGGQLSISALDSTLADVLTKVAALTGVTIEVPAGANSERMPIIELGPGPARQVLATLLSDSNVDYVIQASDTEPEKIRSVLIMIRQKKGSGGPNGTEMASRFSRSPYARGGAPAPRPEETAPESSVPSQPESTTAEAAPQNPAPAPTQADPSMQLPPTQPEPLNPMRVAPMSPPQTLNSDSISQQLQQMYQQRAQMVQQDKQANGAVTPPAK